MRSYWTQAYQRLRDDHSRSLRELEDAHRIIGILLHRYPGHSTIIEARELAEVPAHARLLRADTLTGMRLGVDYGTPPVSDSGS